MDIKFSIVLPNYNSAKWVKKCLESILNQSYTNFELIIVDDMSTDNSIDIIKQYKDERLKLIELQTKRYNGGTRNVGVENSTGDYILFIDCDDWFYNNNVLNEIYKVIKKGNADLIRLPYKGFTNRGSFKIGLHEPDLDTLANTVFVAPWTKCIKRELFVPFPENTLLEDVVQHIAQIDNIETFDYCLTPVIVWNRTNDSAISSEVKKYTKDSKRYSSVYRNVADLIDLKCKHDYCEKQRLFRLNNYLDIIKKDDVLGLINGVRANEVQ